MDSNGRGEFEAIERLRSLLPPAPGGETWIGDDAAVVASPGRRMLLTADAVVAGVHADLSLVDLDDMGWKAMAVNVSDVAAMGGTPSCALVVVSGPAGTDVEMLYRGIAEAAAAYACPVVGGDLSTGDQLAVSVFVAGAVEGGEPVLRSGARPDDVVYVTGTLGASAAGLRVLRGGEGAREDDPRVRAHRRPEAKVAEGRAARDAGATAMIDVSDGLAGDLRHLARASKVGVALDRLPVADGAEEAEALGGGEDYELVFTAAGTRPVEGVFEEAGLRQPIRIGRCTPDAGTLLLHGEPLPALGWEHAWR